MPAGSNGLRPWMPRLARAAGEALDAAGERAAPDRGRLASCR